MRKNEFQDWTIKMRNLNIRCNLNLITHIHSCLFYFQPDSLHKEYKILLSIWQVMLHNDDDFNSTFFNFD